MGTWEWLFWLSNTIIICSPHSHHRGSAAGTVRKLLFGMKRVSSGALLLGNSSPEHCHFKKGCFTVWQDGSAETGACQQARQPELETQWVKERTECHKWSLHGMYTHMRAHKTKIIFLENCFSSTTVNYQPFFSRSLPGEVMLP